MKTGGIQPAFGQIKNSLCFQVKVKWAGFFFIFLLQCHPLEIKVYRLKRECLITEVVNKLRCHGHAFHVDIRVLKGCVFCRQPGFYFRISKRYGLVCSNMKMGSSEAQLFIRPIYLCVAGDFYKMIGSEVGMNPF